MSNNFIVNIALFLIPMKYSLILKVHSVVLGEDFFYS